MQYKFSNFALTSLLRDLSTTDSKIYVEDNSKFPDLVAPELARIILVGSCSDSAEIIDISGKCSGCLEINARGLEGTSPTAFKSGDYALLDLTAEHTQNIYDSWSWFLGSFCPAPSTDNYGNPLQEGMLYYDTCTNQVYVWNGSTWDDLTNPAPTVAAAYTFLDNDQDLTAPFNLPLIDIYGNQMPDLYPDRHLIELFLNGVRQPEEVDPAVMSGSFRVDWNLNRVVMLENVLQGALVEVVIHHIATREELILRTRAHSSGFSLEYS